MNDYENLCIKEEEIESTFEELVGRAFRGEDLHYNIYIGDNDFLFGVYRINKRPDICLWRGVVSQKSLYQRQNEDPKDYHKIVETLVQRTKDSLNGILHCSACGAPFPAEEVAGYKRSYFAGVYCQKCWDETYKAIEAAETYD